MRIMDFGLAKATTDQRLTRTGTLVGTVAYFSPEQVISKEIDLRSDVYSLGTVLYEAICGEPPFTGEMQAILYRIVHENPDPFAHWGRTSPPNWRRSSSGRWQRIRRNATAAPARWPRR